MANLKKDVRNNLILDPSFFAHRGALSNFFKSGLSKQYRVIVPTAIHKAIRIKSYEEFMGIVGVWEATYRELEDVWSEILDLQAQIIQTFIPCKRVLEELSEEKREALYKIEKVVSIPEYRYQTRSLAAIETAKEIVVTSCVASLILSISDKAKNWYNRLNGMVVKKTEKNRTMMKIKEEYREKMRAAGWKGRILIWLAKHAPIPYFGNAVDLVLVVFADGTHRCQNCNKSLWKLPKDIKFCPYCSSQVP